MKHEDVKLDELLRKWRCPMENDPRLEAEVWQRIADRDEVPWGEKVLMPSWATHRWSGPALAASIALVAIFGGIGAAELRMRDATEFSSASDPQAAYFQSINPIALASHEHR